MSVKEAVKNRNIDSADYKNPDGVDIHVGGRIKSRREQCGMTQSELGNILGVTFQQVQKYELAKNRVSASRLYHLGQILSVPVQYFFEGYEVKKVRQPRNNKNAKGQDFSWLENQQGDLMQRRETADLVGLYYNVKSEDVRRSFIKMLKSIVAI